MSTDAPSVASASSSGETSRRRALALLGAGGAAGLATPLSRDEAQAGHDGTNVLHLGVSNTNPPGNGTTLHASAGPGDALTIFGDLRIFGDPSGGPTLTVSRGSVNSATIAIHGASPGLEGAGVLGSGGSIDNPGPGGRGTGVRGVSGTGWGVRGIATGAGIGVEAESPDGHALVVRGRAALSTAGSAVVPVGASSVFVANPAVSADSHISVTLASNPGSRHVTWVERSPGSGFTVHLSSAPPKQRPETALTYLIVETRLPAEGI